MHDHVIAAGRWLTTNRQRIALTTGLALAVALLIAATPALLLLAAVEWKLSRRTKRLLALAILTQLARGVVWMWDELHGAPHGAWHPCAQCHRPIEEPSRAAYCSHACRRYARLERDAQANDPRIAERAERRLQAIRVQQLAEQNPQWVEVPF